MQAPRLSEVTLRGSWLRHVVRQEGFTQTRTRKLTVPVSRGSISRGTLRQEALWGPRCRGPVPAACGLSTPFPAQRSQASWKKLFRAGAGNVEGDRGQQEGGKGPQTREPPGRQQSEHR